MIITGFEVLEEDLLQNLVKLLKTNEDLFERNCIFCSLGLTRSFDWFVYSLGCSRCLNQVGGGLFTTSERSDCIQTLAIIRVFNTASKRMM